MKQLKFDYLPNGNDTWVVIGLGKIINEFKGSYKQQLILRKLLKNEDPLNFMAIRPEFDSLHSNIVDIGSIRIFSPGTIIQNKQIKLFVEDYIQKVELKIPAPQSLTEDNFEILGIQKMLPGLSDFQSIKARWFEDSGKSLRFVFPCSVIADYYFFGMTPLTKAVLEGTLDRHVKGRNTVFNPKRVRRDVSSTGKSVAFVELGKKMFLEDKVKIARLAHDDFYLTRCQDVYTSLLNKKPNGSFMDANFPLEKSTELSVYGVFVKDNFLVHSISRCSSMPPFDLLMVYKPFKGKSQHNLSEKETLEDALLKVKPSVIRSVTHLDPRNIEDVNRVRPQWDAGSETLSYSRDQSSSFPDCDSINVQDFDDAKKSDQVKDWIHKNGLAWAFSTNPDKTGSTNSIHLNFSVQGPCIPLKREPTNAFSIIEKLSSTLQVYLRLKNCKVTSKICCPVRVGEDKYSAFPVDLILSNSEYRTKENINFCFVKVREFGHEIHRRVLIQHLSIDGSNFYIIDVEPKYVNKIKSQPMMTSAVLFHSKSELSEEDMIDILLQIVISFKTNDSRWEFLETKYGYDFLKLQHRVIQSNHHRILKFLFKLNIV